MPPKETTLYLARHGQSEWNHGARITGQLDIGLSDKGREQSLVLAQCLEPAPLAAIYTSRLRRTIATAQPTAAAKRLPPTPLAALDEIHMGMLQGRMRDERDPEATALWARWQADPWGFTVPGGERFDAFAQRVTDALNALLERHAGESILVVGHRATNRVLLGTLLAQPPARWREIGPRNKHCYRIGLAEALEPRVETYVLSGGKAGSRLAGFVP